MLNKEKSFKSELREWIGFLVHIKLIGKDALNVPSKSTYDRNMKAITSLGIASMFSDKVFPPLDLTSLIV